MDSTLQVLLEVGAVVILWLAIRTGMRWWVRRTAGGGPKQDEQRFDRRNLVVLSQTTISDLEGAARHILDRLAGDKAGSHLLYRTPNGTYIAVPAAGAVLERGETGKSVIYGQSEWQVVS